MIMRFRQPRASKKQDDFAMDMIDGIRRPEIKRQAFESVNAVEKREQPRAPKSQSHHSNGNTKDDLTMDRMDGINRPAVKKKAIESIEALDKDQDFGMFETKDMPKRRSTLKHVVLEENMTGTAMTTCRSFTSLNDLYQEKAFNTMDGVRRKRGSCKHDTDADAKLATELMKARQATSDNMSDSSSERAGSTVPSHYEEQDIGDQ